MDGLRLVLLIVGLLFIAGIYLHGTRWRREEPEEDFDDVDPDSYLDTLNTHESESTVDRGGAEKSTYESADSDFIAGADFGALHTENVAEETDVESLLDDFRASAVAGDEPPLEEALSSLGSETDGESSLEGLDFIVPDTPSAAEVEAGMEGLRSLAVGATEPPATGGGADVLVMAISVMVKDPAQRLTGPNIVRALQMAGFTYGEMKIFHYFDPSADVSDTPLFSAVNVINPGTFDLDAVDEISTPGMAVFMRTHGETTAVQTFDKMLEVGASLAETLQAELLDETRSALTKQSINHARERIVESMRKRRLAH